MTTEIPVVDPKDIPMIAQGDDDWRARFDALREAHPFFRVGEDPRVLGFDKVDFDRKTNRHLAFNQGWRQCIGLFFARRARNFAVTEWHRRIPRYSLDRTCPLVDQIYAGVGFHDLPLQWRIG